jgi:VanZ family protein
MPASMTLRSAARLTVWLALALYIGLLALIVLWPVPVDRPARGLLGDVLETLHRHGVPAWINYGVVEAAANVLLFLPFGLLAGLLLPRRRRWLAAAGAVLLSAGIELAQSGLLPERFGTVQDVLANTAGAVLGVAAASLLPGQRPVRRGPAARS